ncbi:hypothetical protein BH09VER1_BH09VER1_50010 [soil metagenome]
MARYLASDGSIKEVTPQDSIWQVVARAYGTMVNGAPINWDKSELEGGPGVAAQHIIPRDGRPGLIRIGVLYQADEVTRQQSFDELWADCVFELSNVTNAGKFMEVYRRAIGGEVSRKAWLEANTRLEYSALVALKSFYSEVWRPWSLRNRASHESACWLRDTPGTYEEWIAKYPADSSYLKIWGSYYDKEIVPYVIKTKGFDPTGR